MILSFLYCVCVKCLYVHSVSQMPTTMEQLLEHQWEQGSEFLMQQGQHFDSKYILSLTFYRATQSARS